MSASVGVTCGACGADIGDQFRPGDATLLALAHLPQCPAAEKSHPDHTNGSQP